MKTLPTELTIVERAIAFAVRAHAGQYRKDSAAPYVVHPVEVLKRVADLGITDPEMLAAAALHDVVEDTGVELPEIEAEFGPRVARWVDELSYEPDKDGSKADYMASFGSSSVEALVLKLCDRAANVDDYGRGRPGYVPAYSGKALSLYEAVDARGDEIRAAFGAALAERAAAESVRLRALAATD